MVKKWGTLIYALKVLLGLDQEWGKMFDYETDWGKDEIEENWANRGLFGSGRSKREINRFEMKRKQEKQDKLRKRFVEGLSVISS